MKKTIYAALLSLVLTGCNGDVDKWNEWPGWPVPDPVTLNGEKLEESVYDKFESKTMTLAAGEELTFTGIDDVASILPPDYFEVISLSKARFTGAPGSYLLSYDPDKQLLYIEQPDARYPEALWFCGQGWGHGASGEVTTSGWSWATAANGLYCKKSDTGNVFTLTVFLSADFKFKFFTLRGWKDNGATEITAAPADNITIKNPLAVAGNSSGDFVAGPLFQSGRYLLTLDMDNRTFAADFLDGEIQELNASINGQKLEVLSGSQSMLGASLDLRKGDRITFQGMGDVTKALQPDFYDNVTRGEATFTGADGTYEIYYDIASGLIYTQHPSDGKYPASLWLCGEGWGHPMAGSANCSAWNWNDVKGAVLADRIADNVYETTVYLADAFKIKFFQQHGWGGEFGSLDCICYPQDMLAPGHVSDSSTGYGHFTGDFVKGSNFQAGVYRIRIDTERKICALVDKTDWESLPNVRKINGKSLTWEYPLGSNFMGMDLNLTNGQEMTFEGFGDVRSLRNSLHPDFFQITGDKVIFTAPDGQYRLLYKKDRGIIYCAPPDNENKPNGLWVTGVAVGHPCQSNGVHDESTYGWDDPKDYFYLVPMGDGIYQGTLYLENRSNGEGFGFMIYPARWDWNILYGTENTVIKNEGNSHVGDNGGSNNFGPDTPEGGFEAGVYKVKVDTKTSPVTVTFSR